MDDRRAFLSIVDLFRDLTPEVMAYLEKNMSFIVYQPGTVIYEPSEQRHVLHALKAGKVAVYRPGPNGRRTVVATLSRGAVFGEMPLLGQHMHESAAEALTECVVCHMTWDDMQHLILDHPDVAVRLVQALGTRLTDAEARITRLTLQSVPARLAGLLLWLAAESSYQRPVIRGFTHHLLADLIGTTRETVTVALNEFEDSGIIDIGRRRITILDQERLTQIAGGRVNVQQREDQG